MKKKKGKFNKFLNSKITTVVLMSIILIPILIFGGILIRDKMQTGSPVIGSRNDNQLANKITKEQVAEIEEAISEDMILKQKVNLKSSTLRIYVEVSQELSYEVIEELGGRILEQVSAILPIEEYFTNSETNKQYDLEIHVYNDAEDLDSEIFLYYEIMHNGSMTETSFEWMTDARDPEFKQAVIELRDQKRAELEGGTEEDEAGEE